jgi:hypothetical protein
MIAIEVGGVVLLVVLGVVATWMAVVGLMGAVGAVRLRRCRVCGHIHVGGLEGQPMVCTYCRHPWLAGHLMPVRVHHLFPGEMEPVSTPVPVPDRTKN